MPEETMPLWIRGGRLIDPARPDVHLVDGRGDVLIADGVVVASGDPALVARAAQHMTDGTLSADGAVPTANSGSARVGRAPRIIDVPTGQVVAPGFIDLHVHLREPGLEIRETVRTGARAAAAGGYTTICCMPNTAPVLDNRGVLEWVHALAHQADARVLPIAAITVGQRGEQLTEMGELAAAGAVAFSDDGKPVASSAMLRLALQYALPLDRPIVNHCEDPMLVGGGVMHEGPVATRLGLRGWPAAGETLMLARDLELAGITGGRYHAAHLSVAPSIELVRRAKDAGWRVTAEVTPHHLLLSHAWVAGQREGVLATAPGPRYDTRAKVNPPLRTLDDAAALLAALVDGTIDVIATDHAPHSAVEKVCTFDEAAFGITGLETAFGGLMALVHAQRLPLATLIAALTIRPALAFDLATRIGRPVGTLAPGASGDVVIFDPDAVWPVATEHFASRGQNTPLAGLTLRGQVRRTILAGRVVFDLDDASAH